jgi:hypothetical protein
MKTAWPAVRTAQTSSGETSFGMNFDPRERLLVAGGFLDRPGEGAASSYDFIDEGVTEIISSSLPPHQTSGCCIEIICDVR